MIVNCTSEVVEIIEVAVVSIVQTGTRLLPVVSGVGFLKILDETYSHPI